jgi:hypothetical protein
VLKNSGFKLPSQGLREALVELEPRSAPLELQPQHMLGIGVRGLFLISLKRFFSSAISV